MKRNVLNSIENRRSDDRTKTRRSDDRKKTAQRSKRIETGLNSESITTNSQDYVFDDHVSPESPANTSYGFGGKQRKGLFKFIHKVATPSIERFHKVNAFSNEINQVIDSRNSSDEQTESEIEGDPYNRFFKDLTMSRSSTSNNTLAKLPQFTSQDFMDALNSAKDTHARERNEIFKGHQQYFPQWMFELQQGFNIVCYGYGSKRNLLNLFAEQQPHKAVVINGYYPSITITSIVNNILTKALGHEGPLGSFATQMKHIKDHLSSKMLTVIIHNIDGPNLRNERSQSALAELASIPNFFLVCSIDHINSGLLWDVTKHTLFNFSFHDTTTFETMIVETTFENRLISSDQVNNCSRAIVVLQSLNNNALEVFKILLKNQLENNGEGLSYATFFRLAHQDFLASSDIAFKTLLTEFRDHQLIVGKKVQQVEVLSIPYSKENLIEISEQLKTLE